MPSQEKRQRQKANTQAAREAKAAAEKRKRMFRTGRNVAIVVVLFVVVVLVVSLFNRSDNKKASSTTSTTTKKPGATVPAAAVAAVKCSDVKPAAAATAKPQDLKAPAMTIDPNKKYTATISTSCGDMTIALDAKSEPKGVNNFVSLARKGFYDGLTWHRVVTDFVIQGGDPKGDGNGGPGYTITAEVPKDGVGYPLGTLAWAKTNQDPAGSAGSQFFVVTSDHPAALDQSPYQYGSFGKVTKGIEVAKKIEGFDDKTQKNKPTQPMYINKVTIAES